MIAVVVVMMVVMIVIVMQPARNVGDLGRGIIEAEGKRSVTGHRFGVAIDDLGTIDECTTAVETEYEGRAVVDAMTVLHDRDEGPVAAPVIVRLPNGARTGAKAADPALPAELSGTSLVGHEVVLSMRDGTPVYVPA